MVRNLPLMETVRCVDAVNTPNRKPQVTNGTEIDRERPKAQVEALTKTESRGSSPLSSTHRNPKSDGFGFFAAAKFVS